MISLRPRSVLKSLDPSFLEKYIKLDSQDEDVIVSKPNFDFSLFPWQEGT
jgi:hypothetical protein